jgi:hypothetical protein
LSTPKDQNSSFDTHLNHDLKDGANNDFVRREMMRTVNPHKRFPDFAIEPESNAVVNAKNELRGETAKKLDLEETSRELDNELTDLLNHINELKKQKFKLQLNRNSVGSYDSNSGPKRDNDTDSRATQYLRTDLIGENNDEKVKQNVADSLKVENHANRWLKKNQEFVSFE